MSALLPNCKRIKKVITLKTVISVFYAMLGIECLILIPFSIKYKKLDTSSKIIYYYLISSVIFAIGSLICGYLFKNNMCLFAIMHYIQFFILSLFYKKIIKNFVIKKYINIGIILLSIIALIDFFIIEGKDFFNSIFVTIRNFILMIYGIIYFIQLIKDNELIQKSIYINDLPCFWFNSGVFIYLSSSFMFDLVANYLQSTSTQEHERFLIVLIFTYSVGIIQQILFFIGLQKNTNTVLKNLKYGQYKEKSNTRTSTIFKCLY